MVSTSSDGPRPSLPRRFIVSLQLGGAFFALANVICVAILAYAWLSSRHEAKTLEVKGSAKKAIVSDTVAWDASITTRDGDLVKAYERIKAQTDLATAFLRKAGVSDKDVTLSAITTQKTFKKDVIPAAAGSTASPTVLQTDKVEAYILTQSIHVESHDMEKIPAVARSVTSLIKDGIEIESAAPRYLYSKLSELKIDMLAEATRDATTRATQIVTNANGNLGRLVEAKMGVMQINPKGETGVSDTGNNDTGSLEKEILAVVTVRFELK